MDGATRGAPWLAGRATWVRGAPGGRSPAGPTAPGTRREAVPPRTASRHAPPRAPPPASLDAGRTRRPRAAKGAAREEPSREKGRKANRRTAIRFEVDLARNANRSPCALRRRNSHPCLEGRHCASGDTLAATAAPGSRAGGANGMPIRAARAATSGRRATARRHSETARTSKSRHRGKYLICLYRAKDAAPWKPR